MKRQTKFRKWMAGALAVFCACALAAACEPIACLHPLYTEDDLVTDSYFAGKWVDSDGALWTIEEGANKAYSLRISKEGEKDEPEFDLHLVKLGTFLFLDARQMDPSDGYFLRVHLIGLIWIERDEVRMLMLDDEWVKEQIEAGRLDVRHEKTEQGIVLTAGTKDLQNLAITYALDEKAFSVKSVLERVYPDDAK